MSKDLNLLNPDFRETVKQVLIICAKQGVEMRPYFTIRDPWKQAKLWRQSRSIEEITQAIANLEGNGASFLAHILRSVESQYGLPVTNALPGLSWHQWGEALDCYWYQNGVAEWSIRKKIRIKDGREINGYRLYGEQAVANGIISGGFWPGLVDWVHIQQRTKSVLHYYTWAEVDTEMQRLFSPVPSLK